MNPLRHVPKVEARAAAVSVVVSLVVLAAKFLAYFRTGSTAIFSDALESIVNVVAATFAAYALSFAHRPADPDHPYGHGKIEFLAAGVEGGMILVAAVVIFVQSVASFRHGQSPTDLIFGMVLLAAVMMIHGSLGLYLIGVGRHRSSLTLEADGKHLMSDAITSAVALASLFVFRMTGWVYADPVGAVAVAFYISATGLKLIRRSAAGLLDEQDVGDTILLRRLLDAHVVSNGDRQDAGGDRPPGDPTICSYHKLRHRHSGRYHWVDFHLVVPGWWDVARGHEVGSAIEYEIEQALGEGKATAHVEPCKGEDCAACADKAAGAMRKVKGDSR